jgi:hypothetical protein
MVIGRLGVECEARDERDRVRKAGKRELPDDGLPFAAPTGQAGQL